MKKENHIGTVIEKIYMGIGAGAMGLLAVMVIFTVIMRYCFNLSWKEVSEFNVTLFAFTTFWAMGLNVLRNEHVSIDIFYNMFKPAVKKWVSVLDYIIMLVIDGLFTYYSYLYTEKMGVQISMGMGIPMRYMYGIMPLSGAVCAICIIVKLVLAIKAPVSSFESKDEAEG